MLLLDFYNELWGTGEISLRLQYNYVQNKILKSTEVFRLDKNWVQIER